MNAEAKAADAARLSARQLSDELERRALKPSGFLPQDVAILQAAYDAEFAAECSERAAAFEAERAAQLAAEVEERRVRLLEEQRAEEEAAVAADARIATVVRRAEQDALPPHLTLRAVSAIALRALAKLLPPLTSLSSLDLGGCGCGDEVGEELGRALAGGARLRRLELERNRLGPRSVAALAAGLATPGCVLAFLSLERNPLTGGGVGDGAALGAAAAAAVTTGAVAAPAPPAPPPVSAGGGDLSGLQALAAALHASPGPPLVHLNLYAVGLGGAGGSLLARALAAAPSRTLLQLQLSPHDGVADADLAALHGALARNRGAAAATAAAAARDADAAATAAAAAAAAAAAEAEAAASAAWIAAQASSRAALRREAEYREWRESRRLELERELAEKARAAAARAAREAAEAKAAAATTTKGKGKAKAK